MTRVARWVVGGACAVFLVCVALGAWPSAQKGVRTARTPLPADPRQWDVDHVREAQFDCVHDQIVSRVPAGASVYVSDQTGSFEPDLWQQRLAELSFRQATIVSSPEQANYLLKVKLTPTTTTVFDPSTTTPPGPSSCLGLSLEMTAR